ncbi:MAG: transposase [bacterium]|nr:transposase [bacterium]
MRELQCLGHEARLIAPQFVKTNKNDASDAEAIYEAICEAMLRPTMRFAPINSAEQQSVLMLHRAQELLVRKKTAPQCLTWPLRRVEVLAVAVCAVSA